MGHSIGLYGSRSDTQRLTEYAFSIGLNLIPLLEGQDIPDDPEHRPSCYLSPKTIDELVPVDWGDRRAYIEACHPLLDFIRPYYSDPYLVLGSISCCNDSPEMYEQTRRFYHKLARWVRKEWSRYGDFYIGPEGSALFENGAKMINFPPGSEIKYTIIET
ncbi:MAG: hypothetical protein QNJ19_02145 [Woeseiaceae bacterium]|nr:hypothetical protein [Woeseiaceae bacterium]